MLARSTPYVIYTRLAMSVMDSDDGFPRAIGSALRRAHRARGLTLRQVSDIPGRRFKSTSVAGYERGERAVSPERFCELCHLYGVPPPAMLGDIWRSTQETPQPEIDRGSSNRWGRPRPCWSPGSSDRSRALRRGEPSETIVLRAGDLEVLATAVGKKPAELVEVLGPSLRRHED